MHDEIVNFTVVIATKSPPFPEPPLSGEAGAVSQHHMPKAKGRSMVSCSSQQTPRERGRSSRCKLDRETALAKREQLSVSLSLCCEGGLRSLDDVFANPRRHRPFVSARFETRYDDEFQNGGND